VKSRLAAAFGLLVLLAPLACAKRTTTTPGKPAAASAQAKRYPFRGIVRGVDREKREISVEHDAVPGFMDAMTMSFPVRDDPQVFEILHVGDRVEIEPIDSQRLAIRKAKT